MDLILAACEEGDAGWPGAAMVIAFLALCAFSLWVIGR